MKYGGIELGGTKIVYGIGDENGLIERHSIPTTDPASTLKPIQNYFKEKEVQTLGILRMSLRALTVKLAMIVPIRCQMAKQPLYLLSVLMNLVIKI